MISLVTQSDGSARCIPVVSLGLAIAMALTFSSLREQTATVKAEADTAIAEAVAYFEAQPSLVIPDAMTRHISSERAETLREEEEASRDGRGFYVTSKSLLKRRQAKFDGLVADALARLDKLPANAFAVTGEDDAAVRHFDHVLHHASLEALALSLLALLLFGMALEDAWGSIVFAAFCGAVIPAGALLYNAFPPLLAQPWLGGAGLSVAVLGATMSRWPGSGSPRFLGGVPLSPWLLIPAWLAADTLMARELTVEMLDLAPTVVYGGLFAAGLVLGGLIRQLGFEEKLTDRWDDSNAPVKNPTYEKAMDLRSDGKRDEAMALLVAAFARKASADIALGMWDVSKELGRAEEGAAGALYLVRDALRRKDEEAAMSFWCEVTDMIEVIDAEPPLFLKIAEVLGEANKPVEAARAIDCSTRAPSPLPPGLAIRAAAFVAAHDAEVASRVAKCAIRAGAGSKKELAALHNFVVNPAASAPMGATGAADEILAEKRTPGGEPLVVKRREFKAFKGLRAKPPEPFPPAARPVESATEVAAPSAVDSAQDDEIYENLDPGALDPSALGADDGVEHAIGESTAADPSAVDRWNSPGLVTDLSEQLPGEDFGAVDAEALQTETTRTEFFGGASDEPLVASIEDQVTAEAALAASPTGRFSGVPDAEETTDVLKAPERATVPILDGPPSSPDFRTIHVIEAVPLVLEDASIKVDAGGKGKTRLPFARVDAIAVAAVRGLSDRPVVVVDLVLNLRGDASEPLRVLRIRSDRFDPRSIVETAANGVEALQAFVGAIAAGSRAEALPNKAAVRGEPFSIFDSLVDYHREVLHVDGEAP